LIGRKAGHARFDRFEPVARLRPPCVMVAGLVGKGSFEEGFVRKVGVLKFKQLRGFCQLGDGGWGKKV